MLKIALKMLMRDRAKFLMLISTLTFATFLMTQQSSEFCGVMRWLVSTLIDIKAPIWVVEPNTPAFGEFTSLPDSALDRVRSVKGVKWAVPFSQTLQKASFPGGASKNIIMDGIDDWTLIGIPREMVQGKAEDLWQPDAVMIDKLGLERINGDLKDPIGVGSTFQINDKVVRVVGIADAEPSFIGFPFIYTTYQRALDIAPTVRKNITFILAENEDGLSREEVAKRIAMETGLKALTYDQFFWMTMLWNMKNTAVPVAFATTIMIGFIIGAAFSGQTFYMFILENMRYLGALKAMGASNALLTQMLIVQAFAVGSLAYCIGLGLTSLMGFVTYKSNFIPFYLPWPVPVITFVAIMVCCFFAVLVCMQKIKKLEPASVFR